VGVPCNFTSHSYSDKRMFFDTPRTLILYEPMERDKSLLLAMTYLSLVFKILCLERWIDRITSSSIRTLALLRAKNPFIHLLFSGKQSEIHKKASRYIWADGETRN